MQTPKIKRAFFVYWIVNVSTNHECMEHKIMYKKTHKSWKIEIETIVV